MRGNLRSLAGLALVVLTGSLRAPAAAQQFEDAAGNMSFALAGDAIITRALSPYGEPQFLALREIVRDATAAFVNLEILFHDYEDDVIPASTSGGTYMRAEPRMADELTWFGFDLVSMANNHTMDFGLGGLRRTTARANAAGLVTAGVGENMAEARAPAYLETPGGRVALISIASTFADHMRAGHQRPDMRGRPGLSPMRHRTRVTLTPEEMSALKLGLRRYRPGVADAPRVSFGGVQFVEGADPGVETMPDERDLAELVAVIQEARRQADWVMVTSHSHEGGATRDVPADFVIDVARAAIDAGADMFVGHGPHILRGIEIYRGKPIFYSLGNFIFQNETVERQPYDNFEAFGLDYQDHPGRFQDARIEASGDRSFPAGKGFWESVLPVVSFEDGELAEIRLHPVTLGFGLPRPVRGRPMLSDTEHGREVLEGLAELSRPFGTTLSIEAGIGIIRP